MEAQLISVMVFPERLNLRRKTHPERGWHLSTGWKKEDLPWLWAAPSYCLEEEEGRTWVAPSYWLEEGRPALMWAAPSYWFELWMD